MKSAELFVEERKEKILERIRERRKATVSELSELFGVSSATMRPLSTIATRSQRRSASSM